MEKKCKKAKWLYEEALKIAVKGREVKGKGEKVRYTQLKELQRIVRRDKKAFLGDHCKKREGKNRMGNNWDFSMKIRDTKRTFHTMMGSIKDRNVMDQTEAEDIKKSGKNTQNYTKKKKIHDPDNHDGMITYLEPDMLECKVKWALWSLTMNKASRVDAIPVELFQRMMLWKCCTKHVSKLGKLSSGHRTGKGQLSFQSQRKAMTKNAQTTTQLHSFHTLAK